MFERQATMPGTWPPHSKFCARGQELHKTRRIGITGRTWPGTSPPHSQFCARGQGLHKTWRIQGCMSPQCRQGSLCRLSVANVAYVACECRLSVAMSPMSPCRLMSPAMSPECRQCRQSIVASYVARLNVANVPNVVSCVVSNVADVASYVASLSPMSPLQCRQRPAQVLRRESYTIYSPLTVMTD